MDDGENWIRIMQNIFHISMDASNIVYYIQIN